MEILLGMVVLFVIGYTLMKVNKDRALDRARDAYLRSLSELKQEPANPDLKHHTLALGRIYSTLARKSGARNVFDEVALMNDINAACVAATSGRHVSTNVSSAHPSIEARLRTLVDPRDKGLVNLAEYEKRRSEILGHI